MRTDTRTTSRTHTHTRTGWCKLIDSFNESDAIDAGMVHTPRTHTLALTRTAHTRVSANNRLINREYGRRSCWDEYARTGGSQRCATGRAASSWFPGCCASHEGRDGAGRGRRGTQARSTTHPTPGKPCLNLVIPCGGSQRRSQVHQEHPGCLRQSGDM
jgi:hypothetical protein